MPRFDPAQSVNDVIIHCPDAIGILDAYGIDTCCGGAESLERAAAEAGVPLPELLAALVPCAPARSA